jgi:hypothetical protein
MPAESAQVAAPPGEFMVASPAPRRNAKAAPDEMREAQRQPRHKPRDA